MAKCLEIDVSIAEDDWASALPDPMGVCQTAARAAFQAAPPGVPEDAEVSILLTDNKQVQDLNKNYRGKDKPTNVLSFANMDEGHPFENGPILLGDVVIAFGVTKNEADEQRKSLADHLSHLIVHGMLHLLGHDHENDGDAGRMEALETRTLADLGIADPYQVITQAGSK